MQTSENKIANQPNASAKNAHGRLPFIQPKLSVNEPGDRYEQEADNMADQVMCMSDASIGRSSFFRPSESTIQRKCQQCEEDEKLQRKESSGAEVGGSGELDKYVSSLSSSGQPLPESSRNFFEPRFGHDFSNVRIHNDAGAARSAKSINAHAYTTGNNIVFNSGQFSPDSDNGKRLMAHELTHVVQQRQAPQQVQRDFAVESPNPGAAAPVLTDEQIQAAIRFDTRHFELNDAWEISLTRDVLGLEKEPAVVDADLVNAIAAYQAENNITADGKLGPVTASRLSRELFHEGTALPAGADRAQVLDSSRRMGTRAMNIDINQGAANHDDVGTADFGVMWGIPDSQANGFVIQHVRFAGNVQDCANAPAALNSGRFAGNTNYWEAWQVINGAVQCGTLAGPCNGSDDTFGTPTQAANTKGTISITGQVSFYPDYVLDANWLTGGNHPAGDLPHRDTAPPFWNEGETMRHQMAVTFDDCAHTHAVASTPR